MMGLFRALGLLVAATLLVAGCGPLPPSMGGLEPDPGRQAGGPRASRSSGKDKASSRAASREKRIDPSTRTVHRESSLEKARSSAARRKACERYRPLITQVAGEFGLEPELVMGVIKVESGFNPESRSRVGARGLMQVMPRTAEHMRCAADVWEPENNLRCGCKVLKRYLDLYDGNLIYGLAAYNAGPGNINQAAKQSLVPFNFSYPERVLRWRSLFKKQGCF